ncbi:MAG: hypothetical protein LBV08_10700, partial [Clostridiales bacterium]|nr:hypothetical protein [Clostridiales bacterium]
MGKLSKFLFFTLVCIFLVNSCIVFAAGSFSPKLVINIVDANGNKDKSLDGGEHYISLLLDSYIEEEYQFTYETESGSENASFSQDGAQIDIPIELVDGTASINFYDLPDGGDELFMYVFNSQIDTGEEIYQV